MRTVTLAAALLVIATSAAFAQKPANPDANTPAVATPDTPEESERLRLKAFSFTEGQARARIEKEGFTNVSGLAKDDKGVWRGTAMKGGKQLKVSLDFQGNVTANWRDTNQEENDYDGNYHAAVQQPCRSPCGRRCAPRGERRRTQHQRAG